MCIRDAKGVTAAQARGLLRPRAFFLVKLHADLGRPLEDMKELSKGQIQKREDHGDGVQHGEKTVIQAMQQVCGCRQEQAGDGNREQHQQRHHVLGKLLDGDCAAVACAAEQAQAQLPSAP